MTTLEKKTNGSQAVATGSQAPSTSPMERLFGEGLLGHYELMFPTIAAMRRMMDPLFDRMMLPGMRERFGSGPLMDVYENDAGYVVECAVPGFKKDDVKVEVTGNSLTVSGAVSQEKTEEKGRYHRRELQREAFSRTIDFPLEIDAAKVSAKFEDGVLKVSVQPVKPIERKAIAISG
jgi:HSP20 family molecular chaperone IbpA